MTTTASTLYPKINDFIEGLDIHSITEERKETLEPLVAFVKEKHTQQEIIRLNFICTHNSRRSHLAQVWAQVMAYYFEIEKVYSYSGGTERTALFPVVATTLENTGFLVKTISSGDNPVYTIKFAENEHPVIGFSKKLDDTFNPSAGFAAIMTCSQADGGCPFVAGAEKRVPITFEDPKVYDGTPQQKEKYLERSTQIATEMLYVFSHVKG